jgi:hypothetical protein
MKSMRLFFAVAALALIAGAGYHLQAQWSDNPNVNTAISVAMNDQVAPGITSDGAGGVIITWQDYLNGSNSDIYAQRINSAGEVQWNANGVAISTAANNQLYPTIVSDGAGGAVITWYDSRNGSNNDIYAQRINSAGVAQWTANGVAISTAANDQLNPTIASDGAGGAIITWYDYRGGGSDIYAQRINSAGVVQWTADGVAISTAAFNQTYPIIASDSAGGAIITWNDFRSGGVDIYAQRINSSGVVQWTASGVAISTAANDQAYPTIVSDVTGGAIITWQDYRNGSNNNIYTQRINGAGVVQWSVDGVAISTASRNKAAPIIVSDGAGGGIVCWEDNRAGMYGIYAQKITGNGLLGDGSVKIQAVKDVKYDQGGKVNIFWNASPYDVYGDYNPISSYSIFRGMRPSAAGANAIPLSSNQYLSMKKEGTLSSNHYLKGPSTQSVTDTIYWQWIDDVSARKLSNYVYAAPTLADSTPQGIPTEYFMVTSNLYYSGSWLSAPDSGYSVDNIPPLGPTAVAAQPSGLSSLRITWNPDKVDPDVAGYEVHRSTSAGFTPSSGTLLASVRDTSYVDGSPVGGSTNYYRIVTVDIHGNRSTPSPQAASGTQTSQQVSLIDGWNMVSVPLVVSNYGLGSLFPTATSQAFAYFGSYAVATTLNNGTGYWLRFSGNQQASISGFLLQSDTIPVQQGWNMIGSVSTPVQVTNIVSNPPGLVTSSFFGYQGSYAVATSITPGQSYWVKVNNPGSLILTGSAANAADRIHIGSTQELPPPPPGESSSMSGVPAEFRIEQNYPNPFNPTTEIGYQVAENSFVTVKVYSMLGQEVATLVNEMQDAGYKSVSFNAANLPSGIYTYRLTAGTFMQTRKMILIK